MGFFDEPPSTAGASGFNASMMKNRSRLAASHPMRIGQD